VVSCVELLAFLVHWFDWWCRCGPRGGFESWMRWLRWRRSWWRSPQLGTYGAELVVMHSYVAAGPRRAAACARQIWWAGRRSHPRL